MSGTKDFRDDHAFLFWMAMNRLDMVVPMGWKLGAYWKNWSYNHGTT